MIIVTGSVRSTPETHDEMLRISREHCARSRAEPGCVAHNVHVDAEDGSRIVFVEYWQDEAALRAHFAVPESRAFAKALGGLAAARPEMTVHRAEQVDLA